MTLEEKITELRSKYDVVSVINLDPWRDQPDYNKRYWITQIIKAVYQESYLDNQRIIFTISQGDVYAESDSTAGQILTQLQSRLNLIDISNFFVILLTNDITMKEAYDNHHQTLSRDPVPITVEVYATEITERHIRAKYDV